MNCSKTSCFYIHFEDLCGFAKQHWLWFWAGEVYEIVLHAYSLKERYLFYDDSVFLLEMTVSLCVLSHIKKEQLILRLVIHY